MSRRITLSPYQPVWAEQFEAARHELARLLGPHALAIHHIGSTAVPGLIAKPTIDMLLEIRDVQDLEVHRAGLTELGYQWRGENGIAGRRYFQRGGDERTHHLHAYPSGHTAIARHVLFRDYLRHHPAAATLYAIAKRDALIASCGLAAAYQTAKEAVIQVLEAEAAAWRARQQAADQ